MFMFRKYVFSQRKQYGTSGTFPGTYYWGKSAVKDSMLNKYVDHYVSSCCVNNKNNVNLDLNNTRIGENGLITYADYCLLLALISTPKR